jgi:hypothetical protein
MKKITFLFLLTVIFQALLYSQGCLQKGMYFSSKAVIDNFQTNYPICTEIEGDVNQSGNILIENNSTDCNNQEEIEEECNLRIDHFENS